MCRIFHRGRGSRKSKLTSKKENDYTAAHAALPLSHDVPLDPITPPPPSAPVAAYNDREGLEALISTREVCGGGGG